ncbi:sec-independent protein translocase protein TATA, chloroplastic [Phalaenopsis equestris]|uniref:sec-independent protein translocase protein TATA, chloroplastic n=1 Tax=Phalaenopsis equestris TaxID=78828 RepID=UPI0009E44A63|nr:sec-independent protein translocase protein TATA, chloroplastic [Phalaenopsis equestris]
MASSIVASFSCLPTKPSPPPPHASLASSSSIFISSGERALWPPASLRFVASRRRKGYVGKSPGLYFRCLFGLGVPELVVIAGVAALVFGPKKLPEIGRSIGKTVKSFQQAAKEFETELKKEPEKATQSPSPPENPNASAEILGAEDEKKELEASGTQENTTV